MGSEKVEMDSVKKLEDVADEIVGSYSPDRLYPALTRMMGYNFTPPDIDSFLDDSDYLGDILFDEKKEASTVYPLWRQALRQVFPNPFYSPYVEIVLTGAIGCVDADTEYLSPTGWKKISEYDGGKVAQYHENGYIEFVDPEEYVVKPCEWFYEIRNKYGVSQVLSPEHNVYYRNKKTGKLLKITAEELVYKHKKSRRGFEGRFLTTFKTTGGSGISYTDSEIRLIIAAIADGSFSKTKNTNYCVFNLKKGRKKERLREILKSCKTDYNERDSTVPGYTVFSCYVPLKTKLFNEMWWNANNDQLQVIMEEVQKWDGCERKGNRIGEYFTTIKENADFISYVGSVCGFRSRVNIDDRKGKPITYSVYFTKNREVGIESSNKLKIKKVHSKDGKKYCFHVKTELLVFRNDGRIFITGNTGKTNTAKIGACYDLMKLMLLDEPQRMFDLVPTTIIEYAILNVTKDQAESVLFSELIEWFNISPFFRKKIASSGKRSLFPKGIDLVVGARSKDIIGRAVYGAILDELNDQSIVSNQAYNNYTNVKRRMQSRFKTRTGKLPGHVWLVSSHKEATDFLDKYIPSIENDPTVKICDYPIWEVKGYLYSNTHFFYVYMGDETRDPFIIEDFSVIKELDPNKVLKIPHDISYPYYTRESEIFREFKKDIFNALRDLAGISTVSSKKYIPNVSYINKVQALGNWFDKEIVEIDLIDKTDKLMNRLNYGRFLGRLNKDAIRFIHFDLSLGKPDRTGLAIGHLAGFIKTGSVNKVTGIFEISMQPWYVIDAVLAIESKAGQEIPIYKFRDFVIHLAKNGLVIGGVSADGFQSSSLRQELLAIGYKTDLISVDRMPEPYYELKTSIYQDRILLPRHGVLNDELKHIIWTGKKVDHLEDKTKDTSDACAGCVWNIKQNSGRYGVQTQFAEAAAKRHREGEEHVVGGEYYGM